MLKITYLHFFYACRLLCFFFLSILLTNIHADAEDSLPVSYDLRTEHLVSSIKDQKNTGCCWSFAILKSLESNLMKSENIPEEEIDLSENHLAWYLYHPATSKQNPLYNDGIIFHKATAKKNYLKKSSKYRKLYSFDDYFHSLPYKNGGNALFGAFILANWCGATLEQTAPFTAETEKSIINMGKKMNSVSERLRYHSEYILTDAICYDGADQNAIKTAILEHGALEASLFYDVRYLTSSQKNVSYYQTAYRENAASYANHSINIIGWDDHYPKENFITPKDSTDASAPNAPSEDHGNASDANCFPVKNGAWLVSNSYGTEFGQEGCFWVSYCEPSLTELYSFQGERKRFDHNYQYDGCGWTIALAPQNGIGNKAANMFTVQTNYTQSMEAVSFYTATDRQPYTVSIYTHAKKGKPESGKKMCTVSGIHEYRGYHTVRLPKKIPLHVHERFSVVLSLPCAGEQTGYLPIEGTEQRTEHFEIHFSSLNDESYCYALATNQSTGEKTYRWADLNKTPIRTAGAKTGSIYHNVCLKAFTKNTEYAGDICFSSHKIRLKKGKKQKLFLSITNTSKKTVSFSNSHINIATLKRRNAKTLLITGKKKGKTVIKAALSSGAYDKLTVIVN